MNSVPPMSSPLYQPLDPARQEIRLLRVEPANDADATPDSLKCELVTDSLLQPKHTYHAMSYVWGDPTDTELIYVNGHEFHATKNLAAFLRGTATRAPTRRRSGWTRSASTSATLRSATTRCR